MSTVTAPDGRKWKVGRQWLPARVRIRRKKEVPEGDGDGGFLDSVGDVFGLDDAGAGIMVGFALLAVVTLLFVVLFPLVALTIELLLLLVLFMTGIAGRVVFRRPWHVIARSEGAVYRWSVRGWRASGRKVEEVADCLAAGSPAHGAEPLAR